MALTPGTRLGAYDVVSMLGAGGMGEVWRARDTRLHRDVALKILPDAFAADPERLARFQREAEVLASLNHPNIAAIYGLENTNGATALVMELVDGDDLSQRIARGPLPLDEALPIAHQIAEALEAAHEQGIIHRDLKPANVKVKADGTVKVLDFGLAKALAPAGAAASSASLSPTIMTPAMSQAGMILGTAAYMSPEQARGKTVDKRADIWAFGCVLYEMLSGQRVFAGSDTSEVLAGVIKSEPDWDVLPLDTPPLLLMFLKQCLKKDPRQRAQAIGDVRLALDGAFETGLSPAAASAAAPRLAVWRRPMPLALAASLLTLAIVGLAAWSLWPSAEPPVVTRFDSLLPEGRDFRPSDLPVVAFSPDGRHFVYPTRDGLYLRSLDELEARLIPGTERDLPEGPFFSPDGQSVAYTSPVTGEMKRIASTGGLPVAICPMRTYVYGASWEPDGTILFGQPEGILRVSASGGTPEVVIPAADDERMAGPQRLPDGDSVLFTVTTATGATRWDQAQIVVQSLRTGDRTVVWRGASAARYVRTGHLVYALGAVLYALPFDADRLTVTGSPEPMVEGVRGAPNPARGPGTPQFSVSDQGSLVYVSGTTVSNDRTLALVGRDGVVAPLPVPPAQYLKPRLSPDGGTLVVQTLEEEGNVLWTYDLSGNTQIQQLTFDGNNSLPIWTPDGERITFTSDRDGDGTLSLYWVPADGSGTPERLTTAETGTWHWPGSWSPDGQTLLFNVVRDPLFDTDIWTLSVAGREALPVHSSPGTLYWGAELSPDGRWLAYGAGATGTTMDIYVEPFPPTGSRRRISQNGGYWPLWSRAGDRLFYRPILTLAEVTLRSVDIVTRPAFALGNEQTLPVKGLFVWSGGRDYDSTPDGERLVVVLPGDGTDAGEASRPRIVVVQHWFEELKRLAPAN